MDVYAFLDAFGRKLAISGSLPEDVSLEPDPKGGLSGFLDCRHRGSPVVHAWNAHGGLVGNSPLVYISWLAHTKMWFYTMRCPVEIKWVLSCYEFECEGHTVILVADAFLPEQTCSPEAVVVSASQDGRFKAAFFDDPQTVHIPDTLWGAGHSHHHMPAYTSNADAQEMISALAHEDRYLLRVITNQYCELHCAIADSKSGSVLEGATWLAEPIRLTSKLLHSLERQFLERVTIAERGLELISYPIVVSEPQLQGDEL